MKRKVSCNHFYLRPTEWNQPKPEIWEGETCECGKNWCCPICGAGEVVFPCDCYKLKPSFHFNSFGKIVDKQGHGIPE